MMSDPVESANLNDIQKFQSVMPILKQSNGTEFQEIKKKNKKILLKK